MITNQGVVEDLTDVPLLNHLIRGQDFKLPRASRRKLAIDGWW